jgi:nucleoside-diphosphate-sugar epimerase
MILVTGGLGFVGQQIVKSLLKLNQEIKLIVRDNADVCSQISDNTKIVTSKDLFSESYSWWVNELSGVDIVIHAAWFVKPGEYLNSSKNIDCLLGTLNLAKACNDSGVIKFVGVGTCFEYDLEHGLLSIETPIRPKSLYASSKASTYFLLNNLFEVSKVNFIWCRLFYLYGENEDDRRLVPYIHSRLKKGEIAELTSGNQIRDFMDVKDAGRMISELSLNESTGQVNICSGVAISVRELAEKIADIYGRRDLLKFGARKDNPTDPKCVIGKL